MKAIAQTRTLAAIRRDTRLHGVNSLLSSNPKVEKSFKRKAILTAIVHLKPAGSVFNGKARNVCPHAGNCEALCLAESGRGGIFPMIGQVRYNRTSLYWFHTELFFELLVAEINAHVRRADRLGVECAVRLNGTSDIRFELSGIMELFPNLQFYDYTKFALGSRQVPSNYHLTYSFDSLDKLPDYIATLQSGHNVAVAFNSDTLPASFAGHPVIDGDYTDYRPDDARGVWVGLTQKKLTSGKSNANNGFFIESNNPLCMAA